VRRPLGHAPETMVWNLSVRRQCGGLIARSQKHAIPATAIWCGMTCYDARAMKIALVIAIATLTTATAAMAQTRPQVPVIITSHQEDDPCGVGVVEGLDAHGDGSST
jgi:hypothetical protein